MKKLKVFHKIFLFSFGLMLTIVLVTSLIIYLALPEVYTRQKEETLNTDTSELLKQIESSNEDQLAALVADFSASNTYLVFLDYGDATYKYIPPNAASDKEENGNNTYYTKEQEVDSGTIDNELYPEDFLVSYITVEKQSRSTVTGKEITVTVKTPKQPVNEAVNAIITIFPIAIVISTILSMLLSLLFAKTLSKPIKKMSSLTKQMETLSPAIKYDEKRYDEIGELGNNLNHLYTNLLKTVQDLESELTQHSIDEQAKINFLRATSHELKTPLNTLNLTLHNMSLKIGRYSQDEYIVICQNLIMEMNELISSLLVTSSLSIESVAKTKERISVNKVVHDVKEKYSLIAKTKNLDIQFVKDNPLETITSSQLLNRAISNILSNAIHHAKENTSIEISIANNEVTISNVHQDIENVDLERFFEPFYQSNPNSKNGTGLGLYITKLILTTLAIQYSLVEHNGRILFTFIF